MIWMTNEEIEKRFKFDLNMGVFKSKPFVKYGNILYFSSNNLQYYDYNRLICLLESLNFERYWTSDLYNALFDKWKDKCVIKVFLDKNQYHIVKYSERRSIYDNKDYFNEIPNYINSYKVEEKYPKE